MLCNPGRKARLVLSVCRPGDPTIRLKCARVKLYGGIVAAKIDDSGQKTLNCLSSSGVGLFSEDFPTCTRKLEIGS
jgi:hypothetical protein